MIRIQMQRDFLTMYNRLEIYLSNEPALGNVIPEKARKSRQMQFRDKTAYVWGLRY